MSEALLFGIQWMENKTIVAAAVDSIEPGGTRSMVFTVTSRETFTPQPQVIDLCSQSASRMLLNVSPNNALLLRTMKRQISREQ